MISVCVSRREANPHRPTDVAPIYLEVEARFSKVLFTGRVRFDQIEQAATARRPTDHFCAPLVRDTAGRFWVPRRDLWGEIDEEAIRAKLHDVLVFLGAEIIEEAQTQWLCNHRPNRAFAARVMAGLSAGL